MKQFQKKYQLWKADLPKSTEYSYLECDTLEECITAPKDSNNWYITKKVSLSVTDAEETPKVVPQKPLEIIYDNPSKPNQLEAPDPAEEFAARYASGPIGPITN